MTRLYDEPTRQQQQPEQIQYYTNFLKKRIFEENF